MEKPCRSFSKRRDRVCLHHQRGFDDGQAGGFEEGLVDDQILLADHWRDSCFWREGEDEREEGWAKIQEILEMGGGKHGRKKK